MNQKGLSVSQVSESLEATHADLVAYQSTLRAAAFNSISEDDVREMMETQVKKAKQGDSKAVSFVFSQILGAKQSVSFNQTNIVTTDVETAAKIAKKRLT